MRPTQLKLASPDNWTLQMLDWLQSPVTKFCVEVLRPSQPNGVMSSAVSLPNHMFTGQA